MRLSTPELRSYTFKKRWLQRTALSSALFIVHDIGNPARWQPNRSICPGIFAHEGIKDILCFFKMLTENVLVFCFPVFPLIVDAQFREQWGNAAKKADDLYVYFSACKLSFTIFLQK